MIEVSYAIVWFTGWAIVSLLWVRQEIVRRTSADLIVFGAMIILPVLAVVWPLAVIFVAMHAIAKWSLRKWPVKYD